MCSVDLLRYSFDFLTHFKLSSSNKPTLACCLCQHELVSLPKGQPFFLWLFPWQQTFTCPPVDVSQSITPSAAQTFLLIKSSLFDLTFSSQALIVQLISSSLSFLFPPLTHWVSLLHLSPPYLHGCSSADRYGALSSCEMKAGELELRGVDLVRVLLCLLIEVGLGVWSFSIPVTGQNKPVWKQNEMKTITGAV